MKCMYQCTSFPRDLSFHSQLVEKKSRSAFSFQLAAVAWLGVTGISTPGSVVVIGSCSLLEDPDKAGLPWLCAAALFLTLSSHRVRNITKNRPAKVRIL